MRAIIVNGHDYLSGGNARVALAEPISIRDEGIRVIFICERDLPAAYPRILLLRFG